MKSVLFLYLIPLIWAAEVENVASYDVIGRVIFEQDYAEKCEDIVLSFDEAYRELNTSFEEVRSHAEDHDLVEFAEDVRRKVATEIQGTIPGLCSAIAYYFGYHMSYRSMLYDVHLRHGHVAHGTEETNVIANKLESAYTLAAFVLNVVRDNHTLLGLRAEEMMPREHTVLRTYYRQLDCSMTNKVGMQGCVQSARRGSHRPLFQMATNGTGVEFAARVDGKFVELNMTECHWGNETQDDPLLICGPRPTEGLPFDDPETCRFTEFDYASYWSESTTKVECVIEAHEPNTTLTVREEKRWPLRPKSKSQFQFPRSVADLTLALLDKMVTRGRLNDRSLNSVDAAASELSSEADGFPWSLVAVIVGLIVSVSANVILCAQLVVKRRRIAAANISESNEPSVRFSKLQNTAGN